MKNILLIIILIVIFALSLKVARILDITENKLSAALFKNDSLEQSNLMLQWQVDSIVAQKNKLAHEFASLLLQPQNKAIKDSLLKDIFSIRQGE